MMTIRKAIVIGGGIAGPTTAMALQRAGVEATVFEAHDTDAEGVGAFLTLGVNGLEALRIFELYDTVATLGMATPAMRLLSGRGKDLGTYPLPARTVERGEVYAALRGEAGRRGIVIEYGKRLVGTERTSTGVRALFADGTGTEGDLLIGADGLRSVTRTLLDPNAPPARNIGLLNTGGYARGLDLPGPFGVANFLFGRRCFFGWFVHPDGDVWWFANPPGPRAPSRADLLAMTDGDVGPMRQVIEATEHIFPAWETFDFPRVPAWHDDRRVLVGDAVHATSPSAGQGASMAIEDAVELARCLRDIPDLERAFAAYTTLRRPRVERVVRHGKRSGDGKAHGPLAAAIRDLMIPFFLGQSMKRNALAWMYDYRIDWNTTVSG